MSYKLYSDIKGNEGGYILMKNKQQKMETETNELNETLEKICRSIEHYQNKDRKIDATMVLKIIRGYKK